MHFILTLALAAGIVTQAVDSTVKPLMAKDGIPGMAVGIIVDREAVLLLLRRRR